MSDKFASGLGVLFHVPSKASSALMEVITHGGRYADIDRTGHAESEGEDVLRIVLMKLL